MEKSKKYLYYYPNYCEYPHRFEITRETEKNVWLQFGSSEVMVSKKTYSKGSGYSQINFYKETPELVTKFKNGNTKKMFVNMIENLKNECNIEKMKKILVFVNSINNY